MVSDPYATLGIARSASAEDIKRAYRRLSKEWHPDKHKGDASAEARFKEINEAYEILGNAQRRSHFDRFGSAGGPQQGSAGFQGFDFGGFDFRQASDLGDMFEGFFGGGQGNAREATRLDRQLRLDIDLQEVLTGVRKTIRLERMTVCTRCAGDGAEPGSSRTTCTTCGGTGQVTSTVQSFFGRIQQRTVCPTCEGSGRIIVQPCTACRGEGRIRSTSDLSFDVPPGIEDGQSIRLSGQGDAGRRGEPAGDVFIHIRVRPDARFRREGADVHGNATLFVLDALLGTALTIETVQGTATVQIPEGMEPGQTFRLRGKGLPVLNTTRFGDHFVTVAITMPAKLTKAERKLLEEWKSNRS